MPLAVGTRLGSYEVTGRLGAGGMGEVYRARDTKLGREVAIKTLPSALARDPDRLARFEREAKLLAALNHAHIGAIYGLDEHEGTQFIVMELVDGQTLEQKLKDGPLPVEEALRIALQIAEALEAAHEKGVVHRDLKPANIMLTGDDVVKVLDFGLAKAFAGDPNQASPAHSPALSMAMTQQGLILGTAGYMSPEQASGQATDQRADIWAFGVVLYEMLTGMPLFSGESVPHVLAAVLQTEPDWNRLPQNLHPRLKLLLEHCLKKKVRARYHSIADVRIDIEEVLRDPRGVTAAAEAIALPTPPFRRRVLPVAAAALVGGLLVGVAVWSGVRSGALPGNSTQSAETPGRRYGINLGPTETLGNTGLLAHLALSRDGRRLAYAAKADGRTQLYLRELDQLEARPIPGTEGAYRPFFSPDGEWIGFITDETDAKLKKVAVRGGTPQTVADAPAFSGGGSWMTSDDSIVYSTQDRAGGRGLFKVRAAGGASELLLQSNEHEGYVTPEVLPGDQAVLFVVRPGAGGGGNAREGHIAVLSLATGEVKSLIEGGFRPRYAPTGHILFVRAGDLWAVPFDAETLETTGPEVPVIQGVQQGGFVGGAAFAFSADGVLMYMRGGDTDAGATRSLVWVDRSGQVEPLDAERRYYLFPRISPNGERLAITELTAGNFDVWIHDLTRGTSSRLTFGTGVDRNVVWAPDGTHVAFSTTGVGVFWQAADGTGQAERLLDGGTPTEPEAFTPDGTELVFAQQSSPTWDLKVMSTEGEHTSRPLIQTPSNEIFASLSPDGHWLAYMSDESGREQVYVRPFPEVDSGKWQISQDGGAEPRWGPAGRELFYRNGEEMLAVTVETAPRFSAGRPTVLFRGNYSEPAGSNRPSYDVAPDGQRFLMMRDEAPSEQASSETQLVVVDNWFEELNRLAPPSK